MKNKIYNGIIIAVSVSVMILGTVRIYTMPQKRTTLGKVCGTTVYTCDGNIWKVKREISPVFRDAIITFDTQGTDIIYDDVITYIQLRRENEKEI